MATGAIAEGRATPLSSMAPVALACSLVLIGGAAIAAPVARDSQAENDPRSTRRPDHPRHKTRVKRQWGVEVIGVRSIAAGYMLVFRYRVVDVKKAAPLFERRLKPVLIDEASGARFIVPAPQKTGPLRSSNRPQQNRIYWMAFANPGRYVEQGSEVSIEIGEFRAGPLVVE